MKRFLKNIALAICLILALAAYTVWGAFELIQTPAGKQQLVKLIEKASEAGGQPIKIGSLQGDFPYSLTLTDVQVSDSKGVWLKIDRLDTRWNPWDLMEGKVKIQEVSFQTIDLVRKPLSKKPAVESPSNGKSAGLPILPVSVEVDYLGAQAIRLGEKVVGESVIFSFESQLAYLGLSQGLSLNLNAQRTDDTPGSLDIDVSFLPQSKHLKLNLNAQEPPGGVLVRVLKVPELPEMSATVKGEGSLEDWKSQYEFHAGESVTLDGTAHIKTLASEKYSLDILMNANLSHLMDPKLRRILQDSVTLTSSLNIDRAEILEIQNFDISNAAFKIGLKGSVHSQDNNFDIKYSVVPKDDQFYQSLAPGLRWKALKVSGATKGALDKPEIDLNLEAVSLSHNEFLVPSVNVDINAVPDRPLGQKGMILGVSGNGFLSQPKGPNPAIEQLIPDKLKWKLESAVHLDQRQIDLQQLETSIRALKIVLKGRIDEWGQQANINAEINSPDISRFSEIAKTKLAGEFNLNLDIDAQEFGQIVQTKILSVVNHLDTEFPEVKVIAGDQVSLEGVVRRDKNGMIEIEELKLEGAAVSAVVNATLTADQKLNSKWSVHLPRLARFSKIANKKLSGQLRVKGTANGAVNSPTITANISSNNLIVDGNSVDEARLNISVGNLLKAPAGTLATKIRFNELDASTSTQFVLRSGNRLDLNKIKFLGLGSEINGDLKVNLKPISIVGSLIGQVHDYTSINELAGQKFSGNTKLHAQFSKEAGQTVKISTLIEKFRLDGDTPLSVQAIQFSGLVTDALKEPQVSSQLTIVEAVHPQGTLESMNLKIQGSSEAMDYNLQAQATPKDGPTGKLNATGKLGIDGDSKQLAMNTLSGAVGAIPFKMLHPALLKISGSDIELNEFALNIKEGLVTSDFKKNTTGIFANVSVDQFPLDLVNQVQPGLGVNGILKGKASLSGKMEDPKGNLAFNVIDLTFAEVSKKGLPPANAILKGKWEGGLASVQFLLNQPSVGDFKINGELPLVMVQDPQGINIPANAPLKAKAEGQVVLDILNNMLLASGNQVKGKMDLLVNVGGVLENPLVAGTVNLQDGKFENLTLGTTLNGIAMKTTFDNNHLQLDQLIASTPNGGSLAGKGTVKKSNDETFVADLKFSTDSAQLVAIDTVTAEITSDLHLAGPLNTAMLKGEIKIDHADIYVPNTLPPSVVVLDVEEAEGGPVQGEVKIESDKKKDEEFELGLDLKIKAPGEIFIRGRGLDTQLEGDLSVTGTSKKPSVDGAFKMRRGTLEILGRKVKFKQGVVGFDGVPDREPNLDFKAEIPTKEITILVDVLGSVSNPIIKLSSSPEKPQDEILSNLLFDKSAGAMTPVEALQLASSAAQLAGLGGEGPGFMDKVRGSLGLDTLKVSGDDAGPGVEAGSYVAEGVYVGVKQGLLDNSSSAVIEYEVTPNVTVESDIGADAQSRLGVKMEWDY